jgi:hypothetical protein
MHEAADWLHEERSEQVAADCGERLDVKNQDENRSHESAAAHACQSNDKSDQEAGERNVQINYRHGVRR